MKSVVPFIFLLFLGACADGEIPDVSVSDIFVSDVLEEDEIDWNKELTGIGTLGNSPDSLSYVWVHFELNDAHIRYEKRGVDDRPKVFKIYGDTLLVSNYLILYDYIALYNLKLSQNALLDSSKFIMTYTPDSIIHFQKIHGNDSIQNQFYVKMASKKLDEKFQYVNINEFSIGSKFQLAVYPDSLFGLLRPRRSDLQTSNFVMQFKPQDKVYINQYINTLIAFRHDAKNIGDGCMLGFSSSTDLVYDSLFYKYNHLLLHKIKPSLLHSYFLNAVDSTQFIALPEDDLDGKKYRYAKLFSHEFNDYVKGNDVVEDYGLTEKKPLTQHESSLKKSFMDPKIDGYYKEILQKGRIPYMDDEIKLEKLPELLMNANQDNEIFYFIVFTKAMHSTDGYLTEDYAVTALEYLRTNTENFADYFNVAPQLNKADLEAWAGLIASELSMTTEDLSLDELEKELLKNVRTLRKEYKVIVEDFVGVVREIYVLYL